MPLTSRFAIDPIQIAMHPKREVLEFALFGFEWLIPFYSLQLVWQV
jgi:hypothetical protein